MVQNQVLQLAIVMTLVSFTGLHASEVRLADGTRVRVRIMDLVTSETSRPGDAVRLQVADDVVVNGAVAIRGGTRGRDSDARDAEHLKNALADVGLGRASSAYTFPADVHVSANFEHRSGIAVSWTLFEKTDTMSTRADTKRKRTRRSFGDEFKAGAVRLVLEEGDAKSAREEFTRRQGNYPPRGGGGTPILGDEAGHKVTKFEIDPDGSRAYVALADDNNVAVIDLKTFEVMGRFSTGIDPDGMAWARLS